jgi:hypothetical protein
METSKDSVGAVNKVSDSKHNSSKTSGKLVREGVPDAVPGLTQLDLEQSQDTRSSVSVASIEVLGGILEAAGRVQEQRRSKHRSDSVTEDSLVRAERLKARYNLDDQSPKGNNESFVGLPDNYIFDSFKNIGILVGTNPSSVASSIRTFGNLSFL